MTKKLTGLAEEMKKVRVHQEGPEVHLIIDGRALRMPWNVCLDLATALTIQARKAEEVAKHEQITFDQALLIRTGAPLGLTDNPDIKRQAAIDAASDPKLRKYIPGGVHERSQGHEQFGAPVVTAKGAKHGNQGTDG